MRGARRESECRDGQPGDVRTPNQRATRGEQLELQAYRSSLEDERNSHLLLTTTRQMNQTLSEGLQNFQTLIQSSNTLLEKFFITLDGNTRMQQRQIGTPNKVHTTSPHSCERSLRFGHHILVVYPWLTCATMCDTERRDLHEGAHVRDTHRHGQQRGRILSFGQGGRWDMFGIIPRKECSQGQDRTLSIHYSVQPSMEHSYYMLVCSRMLFDM